MDPKKRVSSLKQYPVLAVFTLFFAALFVLDLVTPDRAYSELENTTLTQRPKLTAVSVDGLNNYFTNYTKYVKDQVFGRDQWISLQSLAETTLFQKTQSGGILLGREHRMFARRYRVLPTEERVWNKNLAAVQSLGERYPGKVSFMLVPSASVLYPEDLPLAAPQMDEEGRIDEAQAALPAVQFLRVTDALRAHKDEYLYYRTDHHWTTLGAYYAYEQFCKAKGITPTPLSSYTVDEYDGFLGTFYRDSNQNAEMAANPDKVVAYHPLSTEATLDYVDNNGQTLRGKIIYDESDAPASLKYGTFITGDNSYSVINNPDVTDGSSCVVVKESFGNAFVPFLTDHYQTIHVIDYRYWKGSLSQFVTENNVQDVLFVNNLSAIRSTALVGYLHGIV